MRRNLCNIYNRLENDDLNVEFIIKNEILEEEFEAIAKINIDRNKYLYNKGNHKRDSYYADNRYKGFLKEYFCLNNSDVSKLIILMKSKNKIIAYGLAIVHKTTFYYFSMGFDVNYEKYSPSIIIINELIKYIFNNNLEYMDFMRGDEAYKHQWANKTFQNYNLIKEKTLKAKIVYIYRNYFPKSFVNKFRKKNIKIAQMNSG